MPNTVPAITVISICVFTAKFAEIMLEIKYIIIKYISPIVAPFNIPFFFNFRLPIELPIRMLIEVNTIITGCVHSSLTFVYVSIAENISKNAIVNAIDMPTPFMMLVKFCFIDSSINIFLLFLYVYVGKKYI